MSKNDYPLTHCLVDLATRHQSDVAVKFVQNGVWITWSWTEYAEKIDQLTAALLNLKLKKEDRVAILSNTRVEWSLTDWAVQSAQGVTVPIYQNSTAEEVKFILNNAEATILFLENKSCLRIWEQVKSACPKIKRVICFDRDAAKDGITAFQDFLVEGALTLEDLESEIRKRRLDQKAEDWATLIYTSGTTGTPKGVVLRHTQIISEITEAFQLCGVTHQDISLSFLPYAHIFGRVEHWAHIYYGFTLAYAESIERLRSNLKTVRPTIMLGVPRIFEKIYGVILAQAQSHPWKNKIFTFGLALGKNIARKKLAYEPIDLKSGLLYTLLQKTIFQQVKDAFGGRLRFAVTGGAPLDPKIAEFFHSCGILILEGYGLTETTAAICVNTPFKFKFGTVGSPIGDVQIKFASDGEILVKSKKVMAEYYKNPEATSEVMQDGWFATGDIGQFLPTGELKITDRKKDLIKTAGGKYVAPQRIENLLKLHPIVSQVLVHGDQKKFIVALITLDKANLKSWATRQNLNATSWMELLKKPEVEKLVRDAVAETNTHLASFETIKRFTILSDEFTVEGGQLTPSLKVKRKALDKIYHDQISSLYQ